MALWTVHKKEAAGDDFRLVRDGFHVWALLFPLPWLLLKGLWTAFVLALAARILITAACLWLDAGTIMIILANLAVNLIVGFEGSAITRWTLARRGWLDVAAVSGDRRDEAEYRYYESHPPRPAPARDPPAAAARGPLPGPAPDALGLFGGT
ncbi:hypothetical protein BH10PSE7_BH10PSE7_16370 [soil metagenome]